MRTGGALEPTNLITPLPKAGKFPTKPHAQRFDIEGSYVPNMCHTTHGHLLSPVVALRSCIAYIYWPVAY